MLVRASGDASALAPVFESLGEPRVLPKKLHPGRVVVRGEPEPRLGKLGDSRMTAHALAALGEAVHHQGDVDRAEPLYQEALAHYRELSEKRGVAFAPGPARKLAQSRDDFVSASLELFHEEPHPAPGRGRQVGDYREPGGFGRARVRTSTSRDSGCSYSQQAMLPPWNWVRRCHHRMPQSGNGSFAAARDAL